MLFMISSYIESHGCLKFSVILSHAKPGILKENDDIKGNTDICSDVIRALKHY